jgi:hypothetical protein
MATRAELREKIRRHLGHPMVKVELCDAHIDDAINDARDMWIKWAVGNATQERYMTLMLRNGKWLYDLPSGVVEVVDYRDDFGSGGYNTFSAGGINTLFSLDNAMYMAGNMQFWNSGTGYGYGGMEGGYNPGTYIGGAGIGMGAYNPISVELAKQFMGDIDHYHVNRYTWVYHRSTNQLQINPVPPCDGSELTVTTDLQGNVYLSDNIEDCSTLSAATTATTFTSPGFVLLRTYMVEGAGLPTYTPPVTGVTVDSIYDINDNYSEWIFNEKWIAEYTLALSKITLGHIRRKFAGYGSLGGNGIALDGDAMVSEGMADRDRLEEELDTKHAYEGYGIYIG